MEESRSGGAPLDEPPGGSESRTNAAVEAWARAYVETTSLAHKCDPPPLPSWEPLSLELPPSESLSPGAPPSLEEPHSSELLSPRGAARATGLDLRPGRPPELVVTLAKPKSVKLGALRDPRARAELVHKFWHHELQAAELMCWAVLRFPDTPLEFRRGLLRICRDEIRHMKLYQEHLARLGFALGDFPVRDWFWERTPSCANSLAFVAFLGMGLEGANLEHTERFAAWFRAVGDEPGALVQEQVGREEVAHVRFATRWFRKWTGGVDFDRWCESLPPPLTPLLLKGKALRWDLRRRAEMPEDFLERLAAWTPEPRADRA